jgi:hypothetical protein
MALGDHPCFRRVPTHGLFEGIGESELRFGVNSFFGAIWASTLVPPERRRAWPFRTLDETFTHRQQSLSHTVWKLDRVAHLYGQTASRFGASVLSRSPSGETQHDLSIHLDSTLVYLRILPDIVAGLIPYLYPAKVGDIAHHSLRDHMKWFRKMGEVDPAYVALLDQNDTWFELLAGKNAKGVRNLLVHGFARFQHPVIESPSALRGRVGSDMISDRGYMTDAHEIVSDSARGLCRFLDAVLEHHARRLYQAADWLPVDPGAPRAGHMVTFVGGRESGWLWPSYQG